MSAYSYVFDGQSGYLDHALANGSLVPQISGVTEWHINADEPIALDYNTNFKTANQVNTLYARRRRSARRTTTRCSSACARRRRWR